MLYYPKYDHFYYEEEVQERNYLRVKTYNGHFNINISEFFPASKKDFRLLLDIIQEDEKAEEHAEQIKKFIEDVLLILTERRDTERNATYKARFTSLIKKWQSMYNELAARYCFDTVADTEAVKYSSCFVYALIMANTGIPIIKRSSGHRFIKYGRVFHVYKYGKGNYTVIVPAYGLKVAYGNTKAAAAAAINEQIITALVKMETERKEYAADLRENFSRRMKECSFDYVLSEKDYITVPEENAPEEMRKVSVITECNNTDMSIKKEKKAVIAEEHEAVYNNKNDHTISAKERIHEHTETAIKACRSAKNALFNTICTNTIKRSIIGAQSFTGALLAAQTLAYYTRQANILQYNDSS